MRFLNFLCECLNGDVSHATKTSKRNRRKFRRQRDKVEKFRQQSSAPRTIQDQFTEFLCTAPEDLEEPQTALKVGESKDINGLDNCQYRSPISRAPSHSRNCFRSSSGSEILQGQSLDRDDFLVFSKYKLDAIDRFETGGNRRLDTYCPRSPIPETYPTCAEKVNMELPISGLGAAVAEVNSPVRCNIPIKVLPLLRAENMFWSGANFEQFDRDTQKSGKRRLGYPQGRKKYV